MSKRWKLIGYDTFSNEDYSISEHRSQALAEQAAAERLQELERTQPSAHSGGQALYGIQDQVFIERPDGSRYRWLVTSGTLARLAADPAVQRGLEAQIKAAQKDLADIRKRADRLRKQIERQLKRKKK